MSQGEVATLAMLASYILPNGTAVEIGSRLGGSAKVILENAKSLKNLYCIDFEWRDNPDYDAMALSRPAAHLSHWDLERFDTCFEFTKHYLSEHNNVEFLSDNSPYEMQWWTQPIDFLFEDSSHLNPQLHDNLEFWSKFVRSGGIIVGHDYVHELFPDVVKEADALAARLGSVLHIDQSIWWMVKP